MIGQREINLDGKKLNYLLKQSQRAKYLRLEFRFDTGLSVILPKGGHPNIVQRFFRQKSGWIKKKLEEYRMFQIEKSNSAMETVPYLGKTLQLVELSGRQEYAQVSLNSDRLFVSPGVNGELNKVLKSWFICEARDLITSKVEKISNKLGINYNRLTIRDARTRWGSCSKLGNLNFNWKLIMVPEPVIDYVITHELCHLKKMDHSPSFWKTVEKYCIDYRIHRQWLKDHEREINSLPF